MIAEIQQNFDATFRIEDWLRLDANGEMRQLHLQRAKTVIDYTPVILTAYMANSTAVFDGYRMKELFSGHLLRS